VHRLPFMYDILVWVLLRLVEAAQKYRFLAETLWGAAGRAQGGGRPGHGARPAKDPRAGRAAPAAAAAEQRPRTS